MTEFNKIAQKWQKKWEDAGIFKVKEDSKKKKYYTLEMWPYPSANGLHMGHARNYCIGDTFTRFKRAKGFNVLYPMGYDSLGLPAENAAIKFKSHPKEFTEKAIKNFIKQQKSLGLSYDWDRVCYAHDPNYYKWDQWIFLKMFEKGLAYKKTSNVNWCPKCNTVLANEQVHNGKCWRHESTDVEPRELAQWFFKITDYAEELLNDLDKLDGWPEDVKAMQKNWIGKSVGINIKFKIKDSEDEVETFTTRHDTMYGMTFIVIAPEHPKVKEWTKGTKYEKPVNKFIEKVQKLSVIERTTQEKKEKRGIFLGKYAIHPLNGKEIPIYAADFVLLDFGTGIVQAVPAHDQRDFDFAKEHDLPIIVSINPPSYDLKAEKMSRAYLGHGTLVNSEDFDAMDSHDAMKAIADRLEKEGKGERTVAFKLKDWLVSRQRFWGTPIPIIYCGKCGAVPVPEKDLPVKLPENIKFTSAKNPLVDHDPFVKVKCPKCKGDARRETDTMDTFVNSSWYFLRYCDAKNDKEIFSKAKANYWMPIDQYIGGKEHACMHLIYFRFYTKFLRDLGLLKFDEPCINLFNQGMLHKEGVVMSKSKGNVILPEEVSDKYGIDTGRLFLMFVAGPDKDMEWNEEGVEGSFRFLNKFYGLLDKKLVDEKNTKQESKINKAIKDVTVNIESFKFNLAIISLMEMTNYLHTKEAINKSVMGKLVLLMSPFTPHICEEMWSKLGNKDFISLAKWPKFDESKIDEAGESEEESISLLLADITKVMDLAKLDKLSKITVFVSELWKYDFFNKLKKKLALTRNIGEIIPACIIKGHEKDVSSLVPKLLKNESRIPKIITSQKDELKNLVENKSKIEDQFKCTVEIIIGEDSSEVKAKQAIPGKPSLIVE